MTSCFSFVYNLRKIISYNNWQENIYLEIKKQIPVITTTAEILCIIEYRNYRKTSLNC